MPTIIGDGVLAIMLLSGATLAAASLDADQIDTVKLVVGAVAAVIGATIGAITWHRKETRAAIKAHEKVEMERDERRHEEIMGALRMLVQRLIDHGVLPEPSPTGPWPILKIPPVRSRRDPDTEDA